MEQILHSKLKSDETLLWSCMPEEFTFMDQTHAAGYKKKWIKVLAVSAVVMALYLLAVVKMGAVFNLLVPGMLAVVIGYGLLSDRMECKKLANKTIYAMTDKRIMVIMGVGLSAAEWANVPNYIFDTDADGHTSLLCGDWPLDEKPNQRRVGTVRGVCTDPNTGVCRSVVMYGIADASKPAEILEKYIPN